jgi:hypothetical protein
MPYTAYKEDINFRPDSLAIIALADQIATQYKSQGYNLTLRQLYYQFISRDAFPNSERSYKRLGSIINDARMVGMINWDHIEDRGRESHATDWLGTEPADLASQISYLQYGHNLDLWRDQERRVEVWVEKQALEEVAERAANSFRVGYFACKGYVSQSEMWRAGERQREAIEQGQEPLILHLGDHDPSGIDMTRDIQERLSLFAGEEVEVRRLALNMPQIRVLNPPPNPAKLTDSRSDKYVAKYGTSSWELDAISPDQLVKIIKDEIRSVIDTEAFEAVLAEEKEGKQVYVNLSENWTEAEALLRERGLI